MTGEKPQNRPWRTLLILFDTTGRPVEDGHTAISVSHLVTVQKIDIDPRVFLSRSLTTVVMVAPKLMHDYHSASYIVAQFNLNDNRMYLRHDSNVCVISNIEILCIHAIQRRMITIQLFGKARKIVCPTVKASKTTPTGYEH